MAKQTPKYSEMTNLKIEFHAISAYEKGWRFPRRDILARLAETLECDIKDIV